MRLLSFVPFGCRAGPIDDAPPAAAAADHAGGDAGAAARRLRRRSSAGAGAVGAADQWRPSLRDICELQEYGADAARAGRRGRVAPVRVGKASSWDVPSARGDEYRKLQSSSSMPAFAPTAYLF